MAKKEPNTMLALGIPFVGLGVTFIAIEKMRFTGFAIMTLGCIYTIIGMKQVKKK